MNPTPDGSSADGADLPNCADLTPAGVTPEIELAGGNASGRVVRVDEVSLGATVRKPWLEHTHLIRSYCARLRHAGIDLPADFGRDPQGRHVTEFVPGTSVLDLGLSQLGLDQLARVGELLRRVHDASESAADDLDQWPPGLIPAPDEPDETESSSVDQQPRLICHNDATPWNLLVTGLEPHDRWVFIDWDGAAPSTRAWDLAYSAQAFAGLGPDQDRIEGAARLRAIVIEGYCRGRVGNEQAQLVNALPRLIGRRARAMFELLHRSHASGLEPWASMFTSGHGEYWRGVAEHCETLHDNWRAALS